MRDNEILLSIDKWLLIVLKIQPSEIDALDLDDYFYWHNVAQEKSTAQSATKT